MPCVFPMGNLLYSLNGTTLQNWMGNVAFMAYSSVGFLVPLPAGILYQKSASYR